MKANFLAATLAAALACHAAVAEEAREGKRPPRPENASPAPIGGWCDALTGEKKAACLRDERRRNDEAGAGGSRLSGSCDALAGPDKARCLRQGGSIEVDAEARRRP